MSARTTYSVRSYARSGVGRPDTHEVVWTCPWSGRTAVMTQHRTRSAAEARARFMRAAPGSLEREQARCRLEDDAVEGTTDWSAR